MDTIGENPGLIDYYRKYGFAFLGLLKLKNTKGLPVHYDNATVSLFQITLSDHSNKMNRNYIGLPKAKHWQ